MTQTPNIFVAAEAGMKLRSAADVSDLIGAVYGFDALILLENHLSAAFFDLRTGLLGELFQKLSNYQVMTALVVPDPARYGARFSELVFEHATHNLIRFVDSPEAARTWLASTGAP